MVDGYVKELAFPVSLERLEAYKPSDGSDFQMVINYYLNICLCEALYPTLNAAEVSLRNSIHAAVTNYLGNEFWFEIDSLLESTQARQLKSAQEKLRGRKSTITAGRIVAELNFGFWVGMLNRPYESKIWSQDRFRVLRAAFPSAPRRTRKLRLLRERFAMINYLRNRVFHYEPIWNRATLIDDHARIREAIGWISLTKRHSIEVLDRFPEIYTRMSADLEEMLADQLDVQPR